MDPQAGEINFYEELGVEPDASSEQIRDAFRAMVRLLHPDQQTDPVLKQIAERQMRKMNRIYEVLSDAERRRRYDETLEEEKFPTIIVNAAADNPNFRLLIGRFAWIGAVLVSAALLIWLASSQNNSSLSRARDSFAAFYDPSASSANPRESLPGDSEIQRLRSNLRTMTVERDAAIRELNKLRSAASPFLPELPAAAPESSQPVTTLTELPSPAKTSTPVNAAPAANVAPAVNPPPVVSAAPPPPVSPAPPVKSNPLPVTTPPANPVQTVKLTPPVTPARVEPVANRHLSGSWYYVRPANGQQNSNRALYVPEFIEATVTEENGTVRGKYRSRFVVPDRSISPDVNFSFSGVVNGSTATCPWTGAGGAMGEVTLTLLPNNSMRIDWTASQMGKQQGLASGTAVLTRKVE